MKTIYEWCIETVDENDDIIDNDHRDKLSDFQAAEVLAHDARLVLVRDVFAEDENLEDRLWAYVENGKLPLNFAEPGTDGMREVSQPVPQRFYKELAKCQSNWIQ